MFLRSLAVALCTVSVSLAVGCTVRSGQPTPSEPVAAPTPDHGTETKVCAEFVGDCAAGTVAADLDNDGCLDGCKPIVCAEFVGDCVAGSEPADLNGDGCIDGCKAIAMCAAYPSCDASDHEIPSATACLQDDARCYSRTLCGATIWCTGAK